MKYLPNSKPSSNLQINSSFSTRSILLTRSGQRPLPSDSRVWSVRRYSRIRLAACYRKSRIACGGKIKYNGFVKRRHSGLPAPSVNECNARVQGVRNPSFCTINCDSTPPGFNHAGAGLKSSGRDDFFSNTLMLVQSCRLNPILICGSGYKPEPAKQHSWQS